jgi:hypothetical protein
MLHSWASVKPAGGLVTVCLVSPSRVTVLSTSVFVDWLQVITMTRNRRTLTKASAIVLFALLGRLLRSRSTVTVSGSSAKPGGAAVSLTV